MARVHFLHIAINSCQILLLILKEALRFAHKDGHEGKTDKSWNNRHQGQNPVHSKHGYQDCHDQ